LAVPAIVGDRSERGGVTGADNGVATPVTGGESDLSDLDLDEPDLTDA
jgi:hypothetical protein